MTRPYHFIHDGAALARATGQASSRRCSRSSGALLARAATFVAILTSPAVFLYLHKQQGWGIGWSIVLAIVAIAAFRGFVDLVLRRVIPWPSLFGTDDPRLREEDVVNRRRASFWGFWWRLVRLFLILVLIVVIIRSLSTRLGRRRTPGRRRQDVCSWIVALREPFRGFAQLRPDPALLLHLQLPDPHGADAAHGDHADPRLRARRRGLGRQLDDVRGQKEAKEEVRRIVSLWQSGEQFEAGRRQARARPPLPRRARHRARRCSRRRSPPASTVPSSRSPARASRRRSSAWT